MLTKTVEVRNSTGLACTSGGLSGESRQKI